MNKRKKEVSNGERTINSYIHRKTIQYSERRTLRNNLGVINFQAWEITIMSIKLKKKKNRRNKF